MSGYVRLNISYVLTVVGLTHSWIKLEGNNLSGLFQNSSGQYRNNIQHM